MKHLLLLSIFAACLAITLPGTGHARNWPSWRGPSNAGIAPDAQPPRVWSEDRNIKWKSKIPGLGFSTPIVWEDRIFLLTAIETSEQGPNAPPAARAESPRGGPPKGGQGQRGGKKKGGGFGGGSTPTKFHEFAVLALDRNSGKILWQKIARREVPHERRHGTNSFASASPVTDGKHLFVSFGSRGIYSYDLQGNLVWEKDLGDMRTRGSFGEGASPALAGKHLIVPWDHEGQSFVVALDQASGAEVWRKSRDEQSSWSTPLVVEGGGRLQAIIAATNKSRSYDAATGEVIWEAGGMTANAIPMPVTGHGLVYLISGFRGSMLQAVKLTSRGDITDSDNIVWSLRKGTPYVPSPVLSGTRLYFTKSNDAYLSCVNALTGEIHYTDQALPGARSIYASPIAADGHLYIVGREGTTLVIKDAPKFEIVATNKLDERMDASPVMIGRQLFLRGHEHLYCIAEK